MIYNVYDPQTLLQILNIFYPRIGVNLIMLLRFWLFYNIIIVTLFLIFNDKNVFLTLINPLMTIERIVYSEKCPTPNIQLEIGNYLYPQMAFDTILQSNGCIKTDRVKPRIVLDEWITGGNHPLFLNLIQTFITQ